MDATKILSSPATVMIGPSGGTAAAVGYTQGGVTITKTRDTRTIEADQSLYPVEMSITSEGYEISFSLMEVTYANLQKMWDEPGTGKLGLAAGSNPSKYEIQIYGNRKDGQQVKWTFYKCIVTGFENFTFAKDSEGLIGATFTALWDETKNAIGEFAPATEGT